MAAAKDDESISTNYHVFIYQVLEFCPLETRVNFWVTNRRNCRTLSNQVYWHWLCRSYLEHDCKLYIPHKPPMYLTWKKLFMDLFPYRNTFFALQLTDDSSNTGEEEGEENIDADPFPRLPQRSKVITDRFKINVVARFRPKVSTVSPSSVVEDEKENNYNKVENVADEDNGDAKTVTLPLHQRLQLIKMSRRLQSNSQALRVLKDEGGWFGAKWKAIEEKGRANSSRKGEQSVPNKDKPTAEQTGNFGANLVASVQSIDPGTGRVVMVAPDVGLREFSFDAALPTAVSQSAVYQTTSSRLVMDFLNGFNATVIVYGQTGSGKTYTMYGTSDVHLEESNDFIHSARSRSVGIVPRACSEIFEAIKVKNTRGDFKMELSVSYIEIYGDQISDLLKNGEKRGHSKVAAQRFVLTGAAERRVDDISQLAEILRVGDAQKRRAATAMNERSSRAHSLFILSLKQTAIDTDVVVTSKLFFADLGGSEQVKKSKVNDSSSGRDVENITDHGSNTVGYQLGERMREAVYINLGLLALKKCIEALNLKASYVPFQDSKLTMLLSDGLGGDSKTTIIICGSCDSKNSAETMAALRFGEKCALIENEARNQANIIAGLLANLDNEIVALEATIKSKERWEVIDEERRDDLAEEGTIEATQGGKEIKKVTVLVGAESERKHLEKLLLDRLKLIGCQDESDDTLELVGNLKYGAIAFGANKGDYNLGKKFDVDEDATQNQRFDDAVDENNIPSALRAGGALNMKKTVQWKGEQDSEEVKKKRVAKFEKKRAKLVYSGMSL